MYTSSKLSLLQNTKLMLVPQLKKEGKVFLYQQDVDYLEVVTCSNFVWSVASLLFAAVSCGTLTNPANGQVTHTTGMFGQTATYSCDTGYNLVGDSNRSCQATGVWSGSTPTCQGML